MKKQPFSERINNWLSEPSGEQFTKNKWRFWFVALIAFSILNALLTALVFSAGDVLQNYMGTVLVGVGALLAWLGVSALYYSDSTDAHLSQGVAILDSITLLFVVAHFSFLFWVYGHLTTIQRAEASHKVEIEKFNIEIEKFNAESLKVQADNAKIFESLREIEASAKEKAKIEQDTAYQYRQAAKHGAQIKDERGGISVKFEPTKIELVRPPEPPKLLKDTSADYLTRWDSWIRLANFGELALAIFTMIFIRVRSSLTNAPRKEEFPDELDVENRLSTPHERLETAPIKSQRKKKLERIIDSFDSARYAAGVKALRDALRDISFRLKGRSFKVTVKPNCIWIMMVEANQGTQQTVSSARCDLAILRDAEAMPRDQFRVKLERTLKHGGFEI